MNVHIAVDYIFIDNPTEDQENVLAKLPEAVTVKPFKTGHKIIGNPSSLYFALYELAKDFDVELV